MTPKQKILNVVRDRGELSSAEIADALNRQLTTQIYRHLSELTRDGLLVKDKRKRRGGGHPENVYRLPRSFNGDYRREWHAWCEANMPLPYELWLETMLSEARGD